MTISRSDFVRLTKVVEKIKTHNYVQ